MDVRKLNQNEMSNYRTIAEEHGTIFSSFAWLSLFEDINLYGLFEKDDLLVGAFHVLEKKLMGIDIIKNPPFTPLIGPLFYFNVNNKYKYISKYREALSAIADFFLKRKLFICSVTLSKDIIDLMPFIWSGFKVTPCYTYILDLSKDIQELYNEMSVDRKNDIKKAIKDNLIIEKVDQLITVKDLVIETLERNGIKGKNIYVDKILSKFANDNNSFAFVTYNNFREPLYAVFCVYDKCTAYYIMGGANRKLLHHGAGAIALWESIKYSKALGLRYFDFEGSIIPNVEKYFREFGGRLVPYFRINKASILIEILLKFNLRHLF